MAYNKKFSRIKRKSLLCNIVLISLSIVGGLEYTDLNLYGTALSLFALVELALVSFLLLREKYNKKEIAVVSSMLLLSFVTYIKSGTPSFIFLLILGIVFHSIDYKSGFITVLVTRTLVLICIMSLSLLGVLDLYQKTIFKFKSTVVGYGLGYSHPNRLSFAFLYLILVYFCYKNKNFNKKDYVVIIAVAYLCSIITRSRTALICSVFMILLSIVINHENVSKKVLSAFKGFAFLIMPVCAFLSIYIPLNYRSLSSNYTNYLSYIDVLLNGRITIASRAFRTYEITLFGGLNEYSKMADLFGNSTVDNGYVRFLFSYGIFGFSCLLVLSFFSIKRLLKNNEYNLVIAAIIVSIWGVSENILFSYAFNIIAIFWSELLKYRTNKKKILTNTVTLMKILFGA